MMAAIEHGIERAHEIYGRLLEWALEQDIPTPVVSLAQTMLMQYRDVESATAKSVALLRNQFGGHPVHRRSSAAAARGLSRSV